jgi:hypothetical protein
VFADTDNSIETFEMALYRDNKKICDEIFGPERKTLSVQDFMLSKSNKANCAFDLLDKKANEVIVPSYIQEAIKWIKS